MTIASPLDRVTPVCTTSSDIRKFERRSHAERLANRHALRARDIAGRWNGRWSAAQWLDLLEAWGYTCAYCGRRFPPDELTPDHKHSLARGGVNAISNIVPACGQCNSRKGDKTPTEYFCWLSEQHDGCQQAA